MATSSPRFLTVKFLHALKPRATRYEVHDTFRQGLALRVTPAGVKSWTFRYRHRGSPGRVTLGRYPDVTLEAAREAALATLTQLAEDVNPAAVRQTTREGWTQTVQALYDAYKATGVTLRKSWPEKQRILEGDILPTWGEKVVREIRRRDVTELVHAKLKTGAPVAADHVLIQLSTLLAFGVDQEWIETNPCARLTKPSKVAGHRRTKRGALSPAAIRTLWTFLETPEPKGKRQFLSPALRDAFQVLLLCGQRLREICTLRRDDVDLAGRWMLLRDTKNGDDHRVPLSNPMHAILARRLATSSENPYVFANTAEAEGGHVYARAKKAAARLSRKLGIDFESHDCRRTVATYLDRADFPEKKTAALVNHREALEDSTLRVAYIERNYDGWKQDAIARWTTILVEVLNAPTPSTDDARVLPFARA